VLSLASSIATEVRWFLNDAKAVFEPSGFNGDSEAARVTLSLTADEDVQTSMAALETFLVQAITELRFLGDVDPAFVKARFQSPLKHADR
jgi:hypothetical protein